VDNAKDDVKYNVTVRRIMNRLSRLDKRTQLIVCAVASIALAFYVSGNFVLEVAVGKRTGPRVVLILAALGFVAGLIFLGGKLVRAGVAPEVVIAVSITGAVVLAAVLVIALVMALFGGNHKDR
jgi:hypothetical protein